MGHVPAATTVKEVGADRAGSKLLKKDRSGENHRINKRTTLLFWKHTHTGRHVQIMPVTRGREKGISAVWGHSGPLNDTEGS